MRYHPSFGQYSLRLKQLSILQADLELTASLEIILMPENTVNHIKIQHRAK